MCFEFSGAKDQKWQPVFRKSESKSQTGDMTRLRIATEAALSAALVNIGLIDAEYGFLQ
jgi:hypothetical protein